MLDRLLDSVHPVPESGCWIWMKAIIPRLDYGCLRLNGKTTYAHRWAWEITNGPIPDGLCVCHKCDVRSCVNPDHLFLGTVKDNNKDCRVKGRHVNGNIKKTHCKRGHSFDERNTYQYGRKRHCKVCAEIHRMNYRQRQT